jgi:quercetin 2,3-dioxygenase
MYSNIDSSCDSMQNTEVIRRGDIQLTSAGTGIKHSERSYGPQEAHFLQVWSFPHTAGLQPAYYTRHVDEEEKEDKWVIVVAPAGSAGVTDEREGHGAAPVQSTLYVSATIISEGMALIHVQRSEKAYVHVPQISGYISGKATGATVRLIGADSADTVLREGDGAYIIGSPGANLSFENVGDRRAEVLVFDVDAEL